MARLNWAGVGEVAHPARSTKVVSAAGLVDVHTTALHLRPAAADSQGVMPGTRRSLSGPHRLVSEEDGFGLIEVMVSAVLLIILAIGTLQILDTSQAASSMNRSRDVAATLAQADQEAMRQLPLDSITGGYNPPAAIKTVGGINYTVTSTGVWTRDAAGVVTCSTAPSTAGRGDYLTITSTVTWPGTASTKIKPVVFQSIVAPGVAALGANKGALAIKLKGAAGAGVPGIGVTSGAVSGTTDSDGCVVLNNLDAGDTTVNWNTPGFVDPDGYQDVTKDETIGAGTTAQDNGAYDKAASVPVTLKDDISGANAKWWSVSMTQTGMTQSNGVRKFVSPTGLANSITAGGLFPFTSAYGVYAGYCAGNDPNSYTPIAGFNSASVLTAPGASVPLTLTMRSVSVHVGDFATGAAVSGATVQAYPYTADSHMTGCSESTSRGDFTTNASGDVKIPLPYGIWKFCAQKQSGTKYLIGSTSTGMGTTTGPANNTEDDSTVMTDSYRRDVLRTVRFSSSTPGTTQCA
jgi:Tfp pilus assembly protein PilV